MTLTVFDLALIGATTGLTSFVAFVVAMIYMKIRETKRKMIVMQEMLSQMHDQAQTQQQFEEIVDRFRKSQGDE
jgi:uncharacterized membrane protein